MAYQCETPDCTLIVCTLRAALPLASSNSRIGLHQAAGLPMIAGVEPPEHSYQMLRCRKFHRSSDETVSLPPPAAIADESQEKPRHHRARHRRKAIEEWYEDRRANHFNDQSDGG